MEKDTLRMQFLSGVITESEYKVKLNENTVNEDVDFSKMEAGVRDVFNGIKPLPGTAKEKLELAKTGIAIATLNAIGQNLGAGHSMSPAGKARLTTAMDAIKQATSIEAVEKALLDALASYADSEKSSLNESMIGGIVGIGAINQIPPRAKADYETAFEHFLGEKYGLNEEEAMEEGELARGEEYKIVQDGNYWILTYIDKGRINTPEVTEKFRSKEEADEFYKEHLEVVARIAKDFADARASGDPRAQQPF
jgi:hypothetical protein